MLYIAAAPPILTRCRAASQANPAAVAGYRGRTDAALELTMAPTSDPRLPARSAGHFCDLMQLIAQVIVPVAQSQIG